LFPANLAGIFLNDEPSRDRRLRNKSVSSAGIGVAAATSSFTSDALISSIADSAFELFSESATAVILGFGTRVLVAPASSIKKVWVAMPSVGCFPVSGCAAEPSSLFTIEPFSKRPSRSSNPRTPQGDQPWPCKGLGDKGFPRCPFPCCPFPCCPFPCCRCPLALTGGGGVFLGVPGGGLVGRALGENVPSV
jgi:hypothetical protein